MQLDSNRFKGKIGESVVALSYMARGYEVEETGAGSDFRVRRRDPFTGRVVESKFVEVKTGSSRLSRLQMKMKRRGKYKVERPF